MSKPSVLLKSSININPIISSVVGVFELFSAIERNRQASKILKYWKYRYNKLKEYLEELKNILEELKEKEEEIKKEYTNLGREEALAKLKKQQNLFTLLEQQILKTEDSIIEILEDLELLKENDEKFLKLEEKLKELLVYLNYLYDVILEKLF